MATAMGAYATPTGCKVRMAMAGQPYGDQDNAILQVICNQVNGWVESRTGRPMLPYPAFSTTVASGGGAGSTSVTLTSATGVNIADAIMFGPVSGTHEHGIVAGVSGNVVALQWPLAATYAPGVAVARVQLWDGADALENGRLFIVPNGIVTMTSLEVGFYTGGAFNLIPPSVWFLRPTPLVREPGWPAFEVWMTDIPSSGNPCPTFCSGIQNIRAACQPGWPAYPDEIVGLAEKLAVGTFRARGTGGGQSISIDSNGTKVIESLMSAQDWKLLNSYSSKEVVII